MSFINKHPAVIWGACITFLFLLLGMLRLDFFDGLELTFYDLRLNLMEEPESPSPIVIVDIDDESVEKIGRWPWTRSIVAEAIRKISAGAPKTIGLNIIYSEPEERNGLMELARLEALFTRDVMSGAGQSGAAFLQALTESRDKLDHDRKLAEAIQAAGNVILPVFFKERAFDAPSDSPPDPQLASHALADVTDPETIGAPGASGLVLPIAEFLKAAAGIGYINFSCDMDGVTRREQILMEYGRLYLPSYTLSLAAHYLDVRPDQIGVELGSSVRLGERIMPLTFHSELMVRFKGPRNSFKAYSFFDVLNDKIDVAVFKDKLVLVATSAAGIMNPLNSPTDPALPVGEFSANTLWTILNRRFIQQPPWSSGLEMFLILLVGVILTVVFPRLRAVPAGLSFLAGLLFLIGGGVYAFMVRHFWLQVTYPVLQLLLGYIGVVSIRYFITENRKEKVEVESAETNRLLGLSFQSQGMLDMAFDKLRRVPVDDEMKAILYNLALDYERKRQFNKAAVVYGYIEEHDGRYKDVTEKKKKLIQASETMVFGDGFIGGGASRDELLSAASTARPTMGRYEIIKQLGKGAMGVVYLGQDPRINRTTAIKTFRFNDDLEAGEVEEMKSKFFREAESAGTLSHPNIVTIYDAGEEQELAYIAMEYLEGEDLQRFTRKGNLLPIRKIIDCCADIAAALDYAHQRGIVHRDIKPANIMLLKSGKVKITDFGIARITSSSQTRTGIVKGTPYYMSPEQISGKKVDGRSDIFSLGVMMFQLLTGSVPFDGDSPAALMHQILNVPHPDPRSLNPKIFAPLVPIINKALMKDPDQRYQHAVELSNDLRKLAAKIDAALAKRERKDR
ncbi:MAG: CHASE2 domain-containing serine/threonine-protein kinase [Thermodesulfobacteriota bacterium]